MSDLDKLMKKLKDKPKEETAKEEVVETPKVETPAIETPKVEDPDEDLGEDFDEVVKTPTKEEKVEEDKPTSEHIGHEPSVEGEVAILQNDGVFRRELLFTLKELVEVHKANTQTLIDIKKIVGGENAKK